MFALSRKLNSKSWPNQSQLEVSTGHSINHVLTYIHTSISFVLASLLKRDVSKQVLKQLEPQEVFSYLLMCMETPRPSHKLEAITNQLKEVARQLNLQVDVDAAANVRIRKPATPGYERSTPVVRAFLQSFFLKVGCCVVLCCSC